MNARAHDTSDGSSAWRTLFEGREFGAELVCSPERVSVGTSPEVLGPALNPVQSATSAEDLRASVTAMNLRELRAQVWGRRGVNTVI